MTVLSRWIRRQIARERAEAEAGHSDNAPSEVLAICEAHTAILVRYERARAAGQRGPSTEWERAQVEALEFAVEAVGLAYQHRPGYRDEWRP